jgi:hypothetical protein
MDRVPRVSLYRIVGSIGFRGRTCLAPLLSDSARLLTFRPCRYLPQAGQDGSLK